MRRVRMLAVLAGAGLAVLSGPVAGTDGHSWSGLPQPAGSGHAVVLAGDEWIGAPPGGAGSGEDVVLAGHDWIGVPQPDGHSWSG